MNFKHMAVFAGGVLLTIIVYKAVLKGFVPASIAVYLP